MRIGTCDCCNTPNVSLSRSIAYGIETFSCEDGCGKTEQWIEYHNPLAPEKANPYNNVDKGYVK